MDYSETGDVTGTLVATNDIVIPPGAQASTSNSGCEPGDFTAASTTEPQVALIQRGTCDFHIKAENAQAAGYDAAIIFNEGQPGRDETLAGTLTADDLSTIPVIGTSFAIGEELYNQVNAGSVTVRVATTTEIVRDVPTANLLATTKTGRVDRQVVVGAHLDSVAGRTGHQRQRLGDLAEPRDRAADGRARREAREPGQVRVVGRRGGGSDRLAVLRRLAHRPPDQEHRRQPELRHGWLAQLRPVRLRRRRVGHQLAGLDRLRRRRGRLPQVLRLAAARHRADGLRRPLGLRRVHQRRDPGRRPVHGRGGREDGRGGGDLRRHRRGRVRPLLPPGLRHHRQPARTRRSTRCRTPRQTPRSRSR